MLDDLHRSHTAASIQRETLTPAGDSLRVDAFPDAHGAPEREGGRLTVRKRRGERGRVVVTEKEKGKTWL